MPRPQADLLARLSDPSELDRLRATPWPDHPALADFTRAADAVEAARDDPAVFTALARRPGDDLATRVALAAVAGHLLHAHRRWVRLGLDPDEVADMEAQLVVESLAAMRSAPAPSAGWVAARALQRVYGQRRTERARAARQVRLTADHPRRDEGDRGWHRPLAVLSDAIASGVLTVAAAATLWASVCGWSSAEAARLSGCTPEAWRARKSRAARTLTAAGLVSMRDS